MLLREGQYISQLAYVEVHLTVEADGYVSCKLVRVSQHSKALEGLGLRDSPVKPTADNQQDSPEAAQQTQPAAPVQQPALSLQQQQHEVQQQSAVRQPIRGLQRQHLAPFQQATAAQQQQSQQQQSQQQQGQQQRAFNQQSSQLPAPREPEEQPPTQAAASTDAAAASQPAAKAQLLHSSESSFPLQEGDAQHTPHAHQQQQQQQLGLPEPGMLSQAAAVLSRHTSQSLDQAKPASSPGAGSQLAAAGHHR